MKNKKRINYIYNKGTNNDNIRRNSTNIWSSDSHCPSFDSHY